MDDHTELKCNTCNDNTGVYYQDCGAPFYQIFVCYSCKEKEVREEEERLEEEDEDEE